MTKLRAIVDRHYADDGAATTPITDEFFRLLAGVFGWTWHKADRSDLNRFAAAAATSGLPQGLVASGFFANAYLVDFDRAVKNDKLDDADGRWEVADYCRYVDDMRFKVFVRDHVSQEQLKAEFTKLVAALLEKTAPGLTLNADKTEVSIADPLPAVVQVGQTMRAVQQAVSGPLDVAAAEQVLGLIDGLFPAAERAAAAQERGGLPKGENNPTLLEVFTTDLDVRPDTVERFAANRWRRVYRNLRVMTEDVEADPTAPAGSRVLLDGRATAFAKTLVRRWIDDPSNVRLLRVALDVYPTRKMLGLVLGMLSRPFKTLAKRPVDRAARLACLYVLAELFKAGATETGLVRDGDMLPKGSELGRYQRRLRWAATWCVRRAGDLPWYVHQQAMLYLATCGPAAVLPGAGQLAGPEYVQLHDFLAPASPPVQSSDLDPARKVALALVARGLGGDKGRLAACVATTLFETRGPRPEAGSRTPGQRRGFAGHTRAGGTRRRRPGVGIDLRPALAGGAGAVRVGRWPTDQRYRLDQVAARPANAFGQENAVLVLAVRLLQNWPAPQDETRRHSAVVPAQVEIECENWERLADPHVARTLQFLRVQIGPPLDHPGLRSLLPTWCRPGEAWRVEFGRLLRAAVTGRDDLVGVGSWSAGAAPDDNVTPAPHHRYRGVRTSVYKRQFGTFNGQSQLGGPAAPISPWLGELLQRLLLWPGVQPLHDLIDLPPGYTQADVLTLLGARLDWQQQIYGRSSGVPVYEVPVRLPPDWVDRATGRPKSVTAMLVQTVLPTTKHLGEAVDLTLSTPAYRRQHRRHLASVLQLLTKTIGCRDTHVGGTTSVDLVLFPELSVHLDDLLLVQQMADKLKAIVFCGTVFHANPLGGPGPVNTGVWLIPDLRRSGRQMVRIEQGKRHPTPWEFGKGVRPFRPCQWVIRGGSGDAQDWRLSAAICYDATDIHLAADLRDLTDGFIVVALNKDVPTFDTMAAGLHYHMFQHVLLVNSGEFGGTTVQAPYEKRHERVRVHAHGGHHVVLSICELDLLTCRPAGFPKMKTPPAGLNRP